MARNRLRLNSSKAELIWLGLLRRLQQCTLDAMIVSGISIKPSQVVQDLGIIVDGELSLAAHVSHVTSVFLPSASAATYQTFADSGHCTSSTTATLCSPAFLPTSCLSCSLFLEPLLDLCLSLNSHA